MPEKLMDLRNDVDRIVSPLRCERTDGEVPISEANVALRMELVDSVVSLNDQSLT